MFTDQEITEYSNKQPGMRVDATATLFDPDGRVLIVKPKYKKGWSVIGGYREAGESPLDSVRREVKEEIAIDLRPERFSVLGLRYVPTRKGRHQYTQINFKADLTFEEIKSMRLQGAELSEYRFVRPEDLGQYADTPRIQALRAQLQSPGSYLEGETVIA
jgi:ADP-ribose pyrophosphatase YjhB (NUDIX family)